MRSRATTKIESVHWILCVACSCKVTAGEVMKMVDNKGWVRFLVPQAKALQPRF